MSVRTKIYFFCIFMIERQRRYRKRVRKAKTMQNSAIASRREILVIDSHTAGEPTRVVMAGGPDLGNGTLAQKKDRFRKYHDHFRTAVVNEPRGSDVYVGALFIEPADDSTIGGVIFFNNVGYLGMCGHGTIGLVKTLSHLGRIKPGDHLLETPVGRVKVTLGADDSVSVLNVPSYRKHRDVPIEVEGIGTVTGDIAWGGNWFFLCEDHRQRLEQDNVEALIETAWRIRRAVNEQGFPEVDHIELCGPPVSREADSRNFVLCPGKAYDRSPCGTGTSARLACLAADGKLSEGDIWVQESIIGSCFEAKYQRQGKNILPVISGKAFINAVSTLLLNDQDPYCWGIQH